MKKVFLTLGAILVFSMASAQVNRVNGQQSGMQTTTGTNSGTVSDQSQIRSVNRQNETLSRPSSTSPTSTMPEVQTPTMAPAANLGNTSTQGSANSGNSNNTNGTNSAAGNNQSTSNNQGSSSPGMGLTRDSGTSTNSPRNNQ